MLAREEPASNGSGRNDNSVYHAEPHVVTLAPLTNDTAFTVVTCKWPLARKSDNFNNVNAPASGIAVYTRAPARDVIYSRAIDEPSYFSRSGQLSRANQLKSRFQGKRRQLSAAPLFVNCGYV